VKELTTLDAAGEADTGLRGAISRRRALGGLIAGTGSAAILRGAPRRVEAVDAGSRHRAQQAIAMQRRLAARGRRARYAELAPDGFLPGTVIGTYVAARPPMFLLSAGSPARAVKILLQPSTRVTAGGYRVLGDLSHSKIGDELSVATRIDATGTRVALFVDSNLRTYWGTVTTIAGNVITCQTGSYGASKWSTVSFSLVPYSQVDPAMPQVGDAIYCAATCSEAQHANYIWPSALQGFGKTSWL
jgi:hypothetical protein